jgi:hypothetical protein
MSRPLSVEARRLALAAGLTREAARLVADSQRLDEAERALADVSHPHTRFEPPYPGHRVREGPERRVLACTAFREGAEVGTVFTTLIAGRRPTVSVAPPGTPHGH